MGSLTENTQYKSYRSAYQPMMQALGKMQPFLPSKKSSNVAKFGRLANVTQQSIQPSSVRGLGQVTTPYGGSTKYESFHPGLDIANKIGTPIQSYTPGKVTAVRTGQQQGGPDFGNYVVITDPEGNQFRYSHLAGENVKIGQTVNKGSVIGTMGNTGQTYSLSGGTGSHLDLRIKNLYGKYVNPNRYIL
jgi:murein DD-endopeptidase MepM/ murein hydrolase activator NlpD